MLQQQWTLSVEGLGKIEHAELAVRPFMLLVGENNSGKSYLATLLWGLLGGERILGASMAPDDLPVAARKSLATCVDWLQAQLASNERVSFDEGSSGLFIQWLNDMLAAHKGHLVQASFNSLDMHVSSIEIRQYRRLRPMSVTFAPRWRESAERNPMLLHHRVQNFAWWLLTQGLSGYLFDQTDSPNRSMTWVDSPVYIPTARTGFILLYKALVSYLIGGLSVIEKSISPPLSLTAPALQFLRLLTSASGTPGDFAKIADELERRCLGGRLEVTDQGGRDFRYVVEGSGEKLPLSLASSLVTELAPIIILLRKLAHFDLLILEEPEAHLHPHMQRALAQAMVRIVRARASVLVTTHSETFCQQINNFIKLGGHPERQRMQDKYGYGPEDYLLPEEVSGCQFTNRPDGRSVVEPLAQTSRGLLMPTFNKDLVALAEETLDLQQGLRGDQA